MHDAHLDRIISLVEVEQLTSGPRNRAQLQANRPNEMSERGFGGEHDIANKVVRIYC